MSGSWGLMPKVFQSRRLQKVESCRFLQKYLHGGLYNYEDRGVFFSIGMTLQPLPYTPSV